MLRLPDASVLYTVPNALALLRLVGAPLLMVLVCAGLETIFFWGVLLLLASDWVDGKLAIWLKQCSDFGARLDSRADAAMYVAILWGAIWLHSDRLAGEWPWVAAALGSYALSCLYSWKKFGRLPTYHTRSAKTSWLLMTAAVISLFGFGEVRVLRVALAVVVLANAESMAITRVLPQWEADVPSILQARRRPPGRKAEP